MFPIEFRFSGSELFEGGYDLEEGVRIAQTLESRIDLLHVSAGTYQRGFGDTHPSMFKDHGCNVYLAAEIKKHVSIPVATIGGLNDPAQMEEIIASGKADVVYMARALLADPFLPRKVMENRSEDIVHCLRCFTCMAERAATGTRRCTVNPLIGREMEGDEVQPALVKKKVLIAGGGPGGLYAAWTAARRGHSVVLCEKEVALGGILKSEIALPFKREMFALTETYERFARNAGVEIRFNTEVTPEYVEKEAPDALIIAAGSRPLVPPIKGMVPQSRQDFRQSRCHGRRPSRMRVCDLSWHGRKRSSARRNARRPRPGCKRPPPPAALKRNRKTGQSRPHRLPRRGDHPGRRMVHRCEWGAPPRRRNHRHLRPRPESKNRRCRAAP